MQIIYLDQNKWIDLARAMKYPAEKPEMHEILELLCQEAKAARIVLPLTAANIYETYKRNEPQSRFDLAYTQATLSGGQVFRGRYQRLAVEIVDVLRSAYGMSPLYRTERWFLSDVFFESTAAWDDPRLGGKVSENVVEMIRSNPPRFLLDYLMEATDDTRKTATANFSQGSEELRQNVEERRQRNGRETISMRRNVQNVLLTYGEQDLIQRLAATAGIPNKRPDELFVDNMRRIMNETPTYFIERELALRLEAQQSRPIEENDFRDLQTFCAVIKYANIVVAENNFANIARQAGLHHKFDTQIVTKLPDLKAILT